MGIEISEPAFIFGDNQSVLTNTSIPHSTLKKKSSSIAFHFVREGVARSEWRTAYLNTQHNPSDMLTKSLPGGEKRNRFTSYLLHYINEDQINSDGRWTTYFGSMEPSILSPLKGLILIHRSLFHDIDLYNLKM